MGFVANNNSGGRMLIAHACYLQSALQNMSAIYRSARHHMKKFPGCDTLIGRGLSGALVVPRVADRLKLNWAIVRKKGDGSHSSERIEGTIGEAWVFYDDLISSGHTLAETAKVVKEECRKYGHTTTLLGALCYAPTKTYRRDMLPLPEGFDPDYHPDTDVTPPPIPMLDPQLYDTQDENGNPVYAESPTGRRSFWEYAGDYATNDLMGFMSISNSLPTIEEVYVSLKGKCYTQKPKVPQPVRRGGKARRMLMELENRMEDQRRALNDKLDLAATNAMVRLLQEKRK
jgi:hypothetical protein